MPLPQFDNSFLHSLSPDDLSKLLPHLRPSPLIHETTLYHTGEAISSVYFPSSGIVSFVVALDDGIIVEAGMAGRDAVVGASALLDGNIALNTAIVQAEGSAHIVDVKFFKSFLETRPELRSALYRHDQVLFVQAQQGSACNIRHSLEERLARWLLRASDVLNSDNLGLTQEFLAQMLGVSRPTMSLTAHRLQATGLIQYSRGKIKILDREGLQSIACECYETIKRKEARLLQRTPNH